MAFGYGTVSGGSKGTPGSSKVGGTTKVGTSFTNIVSGKPNAPIKKPTVTLPSKGDFGPSVGAPTIAGPDRDAFGRVDKNGIKEAASAAHNALAGFNDPRSTKAFQNLMGLANEQTARQEGERRRGAAEAVQRSGSKVGYEDEARQADRDRMLGLAEAGFEGAASIREQEAGVYATAEGAFTQLQTSYNQAKSNGDIAFANALTETHFKNAEAQLQAAGLNMEQSIAYGNALNESRGLQAQLDQAFNNSLIDNNRYIEGQKQIAAQLLAQQQALEQHKKEFEFESKFKEKQFAEQQREFDLGLKADPRTALRTFADPRYGGSKGKKKNLTPSTSFTGLL